MIDKALLSRLTALTARVFMTQEEAIEGARALPALLAEREELIALLREVEWSDNGGGDYYGPPRCPDCGNTRPGHAAFCRLAAFLK